MPGEFWAAIGTIGAALFGAVGIIGGALFAQRKTATPASAAPPALTPLPGIPLPTSDAQLISELKWSRRLVQYERDRWERRAEAWRNQLISHGYLPVEVPDPPHPSTYEETK